VARSSTDDRFRPAALDALAAFPVSADEVTLAAYSENVTFQVRDATDGALYALRLHRPGYNSLAELEAEVVWVRALSGAGISVPTPVLTRDGGTHVETCVESLGERWFASLTRWVEGRLLSDLLRETGDPVAIRTWLTSLGSNMARMHDQASAWRPPPSFRRRRLDLDALIGDDPVWGRFADHPSLTADERALLLATRDRIREVLGAPVSTALSFGLIHADIHPENVIVDGDRLCILDFDDAALGWHLYDIAVGLFYLHGRADFAALQEAFLDGYRAVRDLDNGAEALLPCFRLARGLVMIGWFARRPKLAGSEASRRMKDEVLAQCVALDPRRPPGAGDTA